MGKFIDLTGERFGYLTVIERVKNGKGRGVKYLCRCDCGNEKIVASALLRNGHTKSCGCLHDEVAKRPRKPFEDLTGKTFGKLTPVKYLGNNTWNCVCSCGTRKTISRHNLISGHILSCGCSRRGKRNKNTKKKHGMIGTRIYTVWLNMKRRCSNPNADNYKNYGARGIKVCDEWNEFEPFYEWAKLNGYKEEILPNGKNRLTLDRINTNGNYEPSNCRWVDIKTQANNTTQNHIVHYKGQDYTLTQLCETFNLSIHCISWRLRNGWGVEEAIETPNGANKWQRRM